MRLIYAELLAAEFTGDFHENGYDPAEIKAIIDVQPTVNVSNVHSSAVECVNKEEAFWTEFKPHIVSCSACKKDAISDNYDAVHGKLHYVYSTYCPHCGRKMRNADKGEE